MTTRQRFRSAVGFWFVSGIILLTATTYIDERFMVLLVIIAVATGCYMMSLRCPICGCRVLFRPVLGQYIGFWAAWIPKNCPRCNASLP